MFQQSLVESTPLLRTSTRWPALISFATQAVIATVLIAIPVLHPAVLPSGPIKLSHLDPPLFPHHQAPTPPQIVHLAPTLATTATAAPALAFRITRPIAFTDAPPIEMPMLPFGSPIGTANPLSALATSPGAGPKIIAAPPATPVHAPLKVSTGVSVGFLIAPIQPAYPQIARLTRTEGTIVIQAIISRTGNIESARVLSGPPLLQQAALDAVRAAHYRPYLLNGQATQVETTVNIDFRLGS